MPGGLPRDGTAGVQMTDWREKVRTIPGFPEPGVVFRDILPVLADPDAYRAMLDELGRAATRFAPSVIVAPEARAFLLAAPLADRLGAGVVAVRKPGKLPGPVLGEEYVLEYGVGRLEMSADLALDGRRALIVDDVLATGGTVAATARLIRRAGAEVAGALFLIELVQLGGRERADVEAVALWSL